MRTLKPLLLALLICVATASVVGSPAMAATVVTDANGAAIRIEDLQVGSGPDSFFDVEWRYGELNEVYGLDIFNFPFPEQSGKTEEAANAIAQALQDEMTIREFLAPADFDPQFLFSDYGIPYQIEQFGIGGPEASVWIAGRQNNDAPFLWGPATENSSFPPTTDLAWAIFTPTIPIPEPGTGTLLGLGLFGLAARRREV